MMAVYMRFFAGLEDAPMLYGEASENLKLTFKAPSFAAKQMNLSKDTLIPILTIDTDFPKTRIYFDRRKMDSIRANR